MINPQTGKVQRSRKFLSTRYPWMTNENAANFGGSLTGPEWIPQNYDDVQVAGLSREDEEKEDPRYTLYDSYVYGDNVIRFSESNIDDWAPTTAPLVFNPNQTYDQYQFEVMRRDPNMIAEYWDNVNQQWRAGPKQKDLMDVGHMYNPITRNFDSNAVAMVYNAAVHAITPYQVFDNALDAVRYVFPTEDQYSAERNLWEYQHAEYEHMNRQVETALEGLQNTMTDAGMDTMVMMGLIEASKVTLVGSQKLVVRRVFNQLRNIETLNTAIQQGADQDQIEEAINDVLENPFASLSLERREVNLDAPAETRWDNSLADIETQVPPRNAATNEEWQQFLEDTNRTDMVFRPQDAEMGEPLYREELREWQLYQMKNRYKTMLREEPGITFEEANRRYMGTHTEREETWRDIWNEADDEIMEEEVEYMYGDGPQEEMKVEEAGGERPNWELDYPPAEARAPLQIRSSTDEELMNYLNEQLETRGIEIGNNARVNDMLDALVQDGTGNVAEFEEMQAVIDNYQQMIAGEAAQAERVMAANAGEMQMMMLGEIYAGTAALVPINQAQYPFYTPEQQEYLALKHQKELIQNSTARRNYDAWHNKHVFVNIGGAWYRGVVEMTNTIYAQDNMYTATVNLTDMGKKVTVPLDSTAIRKRKDFHPEEVATWDFYQRPAEPVQEEEKQPEPVQEEEKQPVAPTDPANDGFLPYLNLPDDYFDRQTPQAQPAMDTGRLVEKAATRVGEIDTGGDVRTVMSYLKREHNEVYTTWRNPKYTGYDENRVQRIFGNVVPFLAYNSEGHPILMNDNELDHHGHTEFNMVSNNGQTVAQQDFEHLTRTDASGHFQFGTVNNQAQPPAPLPPTPGATAQKAVLRV